MTFEKIKILTVVGARPNFMKAAPIIRAIHEHNKSNRGCRIDQCLVHTGQHYDEAMSDRFFADLGMPKPDVHLGIGSGSHASQTAEIMKKFEGVLLQERPDIVVLVGDVNSTVACALVTAKISFDSAGQRPLIAHVEAGLRSFDRTMPEEINRIVTDHISDLLFVTEDSGIRNLSNEGVPSLKIHFVGNTMIDSLLALKEKAESSTILEKLGLRGERAARLPENHIDRYALLTLHRPSNVDSRDAFLNILRGLEDLAADRPIIFPVHPRTQQRIKQFGLNLQSELNVKRTDEDRPASVKNRTGIVMVDPLGYLDFVCLMKNATLVVTDSGGIQEETTCLGIPCVTVRENTERPVTVETGTNVIAGTRSEGIKDAVRRQMRLICSNGVPANWDGQASKRILAVLIDAHAAKNRHEQSAVPQPSI